MFDLTGRVAIVTGGSSGLGEAIARTLAEAGARVAGRLGATKGSRRWPRTIGELAAHAICSTPADPDRLVPRVVVGLGAPQILVNIAGNIFSRDHAEAEPAASIEQTLALDLVAPFRLSQQVFPQCVEAGRGTIVNIASISGLVGIPGIPQASYAASKAGLAGLTARAGGAMGRHSIRVNTLAGFFRSRSLRTCTRRIAAPGCGAARRCRFRAAPMTSPAPCYGWSAMPVASSPARPSPSTAAGPPSSPPARAA